MEEVSHTIRQRFIHIKCMARMNGRTNGKTTTSPIDQVTLTAGQEVCDYSEAGWWALYCPSPTMIVFAWNCRGVGQSTTVRILRNYVVSHRLEVIFHSAVKCDNVGNITKLMQTLGFHWMQFIPTSSKSGGLVLSLKADLDVQILVANNHLINCIVQNAQSETIWQFTHIYRPPTWMGINAF